MTARKVLPCISIALFLFWTYPAAAQLPSLFTPVTSATDTAQKTDPVAILPTAIPAEARKTANFLASVKLHLMPVAEEKGFAEFLPEARNRFRDIMSYALKDSLSHYDLRDLAGLNRLLEWLKSQAVSYNKRFEDRSVLLQNDFGQLKEWQQRWELTQNQEVISDVLREQVREIREELREHELLIAARSAELEKPVEQAAALIREIESLESVVEMAIVKRQQSLLVVESPPLLAELFRPSEEVSLGREIRSTWSTVIQEFRVFFRDYPVRFVYHLLLFLATSILLFYFKARIMRWPEDRKEAALDASIHVIMHPMATALLIGLLLTPLFYPQAPDAPMFFIRLLSALPLVVLVPRLFPRIPSLYVYLFVGLIMFSELTDLLSRFYLVDRIFLLALDTLTLLFVFVLIRPGSPFARRLKEIGWILPLIVLKAIFVLFVISISANLLGNVVLAKYLSRGSLGTLFGGFFIYVGSVVLNSLITLLFSTGEGQKLHIVRLYRDTLLPQLQRIISVGAFIYWIIILLGSFLLLRPAMTAIRSALSRQFQIGEISLSLGNVLAFVLTLWLSLFLARILRVLLQDEILSRMNLRRGVPAAVAMLVRIAIIGFGFLLAFGAAGIQLSNIAIIFGALSVGIGFGLQNIFNNLISGIIMAFERPIQVGDVVQVTGLNLMGEVKEIGLRSSHIQTFEGAVVVVPNGNLISNEMINWTLTDRKRRYEINVGVKYGTDLKQVLEILNETVTTHEAVLVEPSPLIIFDGFGDSSLNFRVLFWLTLDTGLRARSEIGIAINESLQKAGIEIPFPQRDLHLRTVQMPPEVGVRTVTPAKPSGKKG